MATQRTLTDLDTMLLLRRVPLFEGLSPEDLQRVAAASEERAWTDGEALMREGDLGDEMVVLMTGSVRVTRAEPDGSEREVRRYIGGRAHRGAGGPARAPTGGDGHRRRAGPRVSSSAATP